LQSLHSMLWLFFYNNECCFILISSHSTFKAGTAICTLKAQKRKTQKLVIAGKHSWGILLEKNQIFSSGVDSEENRAIRKVNTRFEITWYTKSQFYIYSNIAKRLTLDQHPITTPLCTQLQVHNQVKPQTT